MSEDTRHDAEKEPEQEGSEDGSTETLSWPRARKELDRLIGWVVYLLGLTFVLMMLGFMFEGCTITTSTHEYSVGILGKGGPHMTARPLSETLSEKSEKQDAKQEGSKQEAKTTP